MKLILEQRFLFDGSVAAVAHHAHADAAHADHHTDHHDAVQPDGQPDAIADTGAHAFADPSARAGVTEPAQATAPADTILFIDTRVTDWQSLAAGVKPGVVVVVLDPTRDGITQVSDALANRSGIRTIEFLTDGTPGAITLGTGSLDTATLLARAGEITGWSQHLAQGADIVFWGCDVGQGSAGAAFIADVHTLTGATVGASTDATGSVALGGNWTLEATTGYLHRDIQPFTTATLAGYQGILDTPVPTVTLSVSGSMAHTAAGHVLLGDTVNAQLTFANTAINATGYAPYVEVFAPGPGSLTLSGTPTYNGLSLTTLSAAVSGGSLTNPLTKAVESAPGGITSGTMYLIELPYGSFTPGEPAVSINASFTLDNGFSLVGQTLPIDARAGFEYGALATGGANILGTSVAQSLTVDLLETWATVTTQPGEGETATGPDFPITYTIYLEPAPAVHATSTPITGLALSLQLPNATVWTGTNPTASANLLSDSGSASVSSASGLGGTIQSLNISYTSLQTTESVGVTAYVPEFYAYTNGGHTAGAPILDPATGLPQTITVSPVYSYSANPWNGLPLSSVPGDVSAATFVAKSLAVQLHESTSSALPTQDITYTQTFQVSDYFGISGLGLQDTLGNGLTFDPTVTPVLAVAGKNGGVSGGGSFTLGTTSTGTYNAETIQTTGTGAHTSYTFNPATGQTAVAFDVAGLLPGLYGAGTTGSVTFAATVLDAYPTATDQVGGAGGFLRQTDSVATSSSGNTATSLFDYSGGLYSASVGSITDDTATMVDTLPAGSVGLTVVDVNGLAYTGLPIKAGDTVVYELTYSLPAGGDFAGLDLSAYLPEPVFSVIHAANPDVTTPADFAGTGTATLAQTAAAANALKAGQYSFVATSALAAAGVTVTGGTGSEPANSLSFSVQGPTNAYDDITTGVGATQQITIDFAVKASSLPFVDGLSLTAQGHSNFTPAQAAIFSTSAIQTVIMGEPLLSIQQGVVSAVDDAGAAFTSGAGVSYSLVGSGTQTAPTGVFALAGGAGVFTGLTGPSALAATTDNLDIAGVQAGDTVRIVDAVQNTGRSAAYDVILKDALAQGLSAANVSNLTFTRGDGTVLTVLDPNTGAAPATKAAAIADYFSTGLLLVAGGTTAAPVLAAGTPTATGGDIVYVTYDVTLPAATPTAASLTGKATIVGWTNQDVYAAAGGTYTLQDSNGNNVNFAPVAAIGATTTDTATIATLAPAVTDTITAGVDGSDPGAVVPANTYTTHGATSVPGETMSLQATVTLPQGNNTSVVLNDIIPTGLTPITTAGAFTATLTDSAGGTTDVTASASWAGQTLTLNLGDRAVAQAAGHDAPSTVVINYKVLVPQIQALPIDTTSWGTTPATATSSDTFAATSEGVSYGTVTATDTATKTGTGNASGLQNVITVTNPLVQATFTELGGTAGQNVYSQEVLTYQVTLKNLSTTATAYDVGSSLGLSSGLSYVAGSLAYVSGATATITPGNVGSEGASPAANALDAITLAPGGTAVFTFQGKVDNNLTAGTALKAVSTPNWTSLPAIAAFDGAGNVNPQAQAYVAAPGQIQNTVATLASTLSVIGESNATAGKGTAFDPTGQTVPAAVAVTDSEIVRMRALLQVPEGSNSAVSMTITLPTGVTFEADGSTNVLLVSPGGDFTTTLTGAGQLAEGITAVDTTKLGLGGVSDPVVTSLAAGNITVAGQTVTFTLGALTNNDASALPNYAIVEFNAVVDKAASNGASLKSDMVGSANSVPTVATSDYLAVQAPVITLQKTIQGIVYNGDGSVTVSYQDTVTNSGGGPAYNLSLDDPGAGTGTVTPVSVTGPGTGASSAVAGTHLSGTVGSLAAGKAEVFSYTVNIPSSQAATAVTDSTSKATVVWADLNPAQEVAGQEVLTVSTLTPPTYNTTASAGLDLVTGIVNQDTGATKGGLTPLQPLGGQTVTVTFGGQTGSETVTTGSDGSFTILIPDNAGPISITAAASGSTVPAGDVVDNHPDLTASLTGTSPSESGTNPATLTFTPAASTNYTGVAFDFWHAQDTAPVLSGGPSSPLVETIGTPVAPFSTATVADTQLDTSFAHDFSGTTLTIQRYVGSTAAPDSNDTFSGTGSGGSGLVLSGNNVVWNGVTYGSYTQSGGKLTISFTGTAGTVSATIVDNVLQHLGYSYAGAGNPLVPGITLGAQIDDANNDPIGLNGFLPDAAGPHDQGPGGDLLSNVLMATVDLHGAAQSATFTEPNDASPTSAPYPVTVIANADLTDIAATGATPSSITVTISSARAEDLLSYTSSSTVTGVYASGTLTLSAVSGKTPTLTDWQTALRSVTYANTSDVPDPATRNLTIAVNAGTNTVSEAATVAIAPVNDSPILNTGIAVALNDSTEYQGTGTPAPAGAVGTLVSQLAGRLGSAPANVTDPDGAGLTNGGTPAATGIAITGSSTTDAGGVSAGTWYYSLDNGAHWTAFPTVSVAHPLDLASTARVAFQPTVTNFNGQIPNALTFRAWDGFDGATNGSQPDLTGVTLFGQSAANNSAAGAYSIATDTLPLMIDNVNNAPTATGTARLEGVLENTTTPPGATVTSLFTPSYGDTADQQFDASGNPLGSTSNPLAGVAITGNAATPGQGVWEYSLDNGAHYTPIPTSLSDGGALILPASARVAFLPAAGFSGTPGTLTARLIDGSTTTITGGLTGAALAGGTLAFPGVNVSTNGGATAVSATTVTLGTSVLPPDLSIIGESNATAGLGTLFDPTGKTSGTAVTATDGEIVRMRATLQLPEGSNTGSSMTVTLPTGLTFQADGSTNILLVSPGGDFTTTLTGAGLQLAEGGTAIATTKLGLGGGSDPVVTTLPSGDISVSGQTITFNLGTLGNSDGSALPNYAVVEFNAVVGATVAGGSKLTTDMTGTASGTTTPAVHDYLNIIAPNVTLAKVVQAVVYNPDGTVTVTYKDTETNTGTSDAYNVTLDDPGAGGGTVTPVSTTGGGTGTSSTPSGTHLSGTIGVLPVGTSEVFTYTVTLPATLAATPVTDTTGKATVVWNALDPTHWTGGKEVLTGTSLTPPVYNTTATAGLDLISGSVNQDTSPTKGGLTSFAPLPNVALTVSFPGQTLTETVRTDSGGNYTILVPDNAGPISIAVAASGSTVPANDVLDNQPDLTPSLKGTSPDLSGSNPTTLGFTPAASTNYTGVAFDFWHALDTAPALSGGPSSPLVETIGTPVAPFSTATVADTQIDTSFAHDFSGTTLTIQRYVGSTAAPDSNDTFSGTGSGASGLVLSGNNVVWNGTTYGSYTQIGGKLTISFTATAGTVSATIVDNVLQHLGYSYSGGGNPLVPGITLGAQIDDANNDPIGLNGFLPDAAGPHDQGPGGDLLSNVLMATVDVHGPAQSATFTEPNDASPTTAPYPVTVIANADLTDIAATGATPSSITVTISSAHAEDLLSYTSSSTVTGVYASGTLTLSAVSGKTPTLTDWQTALRSVTYANTSDVPDPATRNLTVTVNAGANTVSEAATVAITPVNDSPILNTGIAVALNDSTEYQGTGTPTPTGAVGTLVSQLAGRLGTAPANVTDPDGAGLTGGATPAATGIAITSSSTTDAGGVSAGTWYYSIDNGAHWTAFPTVSVAHPLDLASTARVAFQPTVTNFNGQIPNALTFRAWDGFDGAANGSQPDLTGVTLFGQSAANNSAAGAYSIATDTLPLMIDNVNNAPTATGDTVALPPVSTIEQHPPGDTVSNIFKAGFGDTSDGQYIPTANPAGSNTNPLAGVAITGDAAPSSQGVWQFSVDGGTTWTAIPNTVSPTNAIILPASARVSFLPQNGFSGVPGTLTVHLIDGSNTIVAPGVTGAALAAEGPGGTTMTAISHVDVSGFGGTSAVSAGTMQLTTLITALPPTLPALPNDVSGPVFGSFPSDLVQQSPSGLNFWRSDDYLSRPLIPDLSLVGSVANRFIIVEQHAIISVPPNIFVDSLPNAQLTYEAKLPDGSPLPSWLTFDARGLTFSGTPPASAYGRLDILIRARDIAGNTADANFNLLIGRQQQDMMGALRPRHHGRLHLPVMSREDPGSGLRHAVAAIMPPAPAHADTAAAHPADPFQASPAAGLSGALRAAGPMAALGRARALLDNLDALTRSRPAA